MLNSTTYFVLVWGAIALWLLLSVAAAAAAWYRRSWFLAALAMLLLASGPLCAMAIQSLMD